MEAVPRKRENGIEATREFVEKLHHADREDRRVWYFQKEGDLRSQVFGVTSSPIVVDGKNCYVTMNNYADGAKKRSGEYVESVNGFFIDIDILHKKEDDGKPFDTMLADHIRNRCMHVIEKELGTKWTCYVCSGRGIALFYLYDKPIPVSDKDAIKKHEQVYKVVLAVFRHVLRFLIRDGKAGVDTSITDLARVVRLPYTMNMAAGRESFVVDADWTKTYPKEMLWEMFESIGEREFGIEAKETKKERKEKPGRKEAEAVERKTEPGRLSKESISGGNFDAIPAVYRNNSMGICRAIEHLAEVRSIGCGDYRNNMLFIYYNNLKVFYAGTEEDAEAKVRELNGSFDTPLSEVELKGILQSVDGHVEHSGVHGDGFYLFSREKVASLLQMTEEEIEETAFFANKEKREKTSKNRERKKKDRETILLLWKEGASWRKMAEETGRSLGFVGRVLEEAKKNEEAEKQKETVEKVTVCSKTENKQGVEGGATAKRRETKSGRGRKRAEMEPNPDDLFALSIEKEERESSYEVEMRNAYSYTDEDVEKDEELKGVLDLLLGGRNAYVSGKGGTGKSLVSKLFVKRQKERGKEVLVIAPSGLAAFSVGGQTVHSALSMDAAKVFAKNVRPGFKGVESLEGIDSVLVDECGMMRLDHFVYLVKTIKYAERKYNRTIQLVLVGDFLQIRPVVTDAEKRELSSFYGEKYGYQAYEDRDLWRSCFFYYAKLEKNRRQVDSLFAEMMDKARMGDVSCASYFQGFEKKGVYSIEDGYVHLCAYRRDVERINREIVARHRSDAGYTEFSSRLIRGQYDDKTRCFERQVFYEGMPVIAMDNDQRGLFQNGQMGVVRRVGESSIFVLFEGEAHMTRVRKKVVVDENCSFEAFPIAPAYAITIHKCQSQTFEKVVVHQGMFEEGQAYVALSRCVSPEGLAICGHLKEEDFARPTLQKMREDADFREYEKAAILY